MMHAETAPLLRKIEELRDEILELRQEVSAKSGMRGVTGVTSRPWSSD